MTAPAVVFTTGEGAGNPIYSKPHINSTVLGYVHGKGTALEVLSISEDRKWAYVGAWILYRSTYTEGWVQMKNLAVVEPAQDHAILVDKQEQTLTLFSYGERVGTIKVSTGKPLDRSTIKRETPAGSYLTVTRLTPFITDNFHYDYPIRYNGASLLHTLGWAASSQRRNYSTEAAQLGSRASHGCVRMERFTEDSPLNAWWLWTHLRWNTRVIVLDNPVDRAAEKEAFRGDWADMPYTGLGTNSWD